MKPTPWLLAALFLAGCGSKPGELEFARPEFYENANRATSPADLRYPADTFRVAEARFIHAHIAATQPSAGGASFIPVCVLLDSAITTLATVSDTVTFAKGATRAEWEVTFGQETPGQWRPGWYRVACEVGRTGTNATFTVVP